MDINDELQHERDINAALTEQLNDALACIQMLKLELEAAENKQVYATWGKKE